MTNRGGRPRLDPDDESSASVHVTLPLRQYDAAVRTAHENQITVAEVIRRALRQQFKGNDQQ